MPAPPRPLLAAGVLLTVAAAVFASIRSAAPGRPGSAPAPADPAPLEEWFEAEWGRRGLTPAAPADDLTVLRRLTLALHGSIPSLEQLRAFKADARPDRLARWTDRLLADRRFADYWAERLARSLVGTGGGQFVIYRRDRFTAWLADRLHADRPWDETVRAMIAAEGLWTHRPAANFLTAAVADDFLDPNVLAGRTVRAFLGQRIDCAQCHDHPFADWSQGDYEGLAAFYGRTDYGLTGVREHRGTADDPREFVVQDRQTLEDRPVAPAVPFAAGRLPDGWATDPAGRRRALAAWVTHPRNRRFGRAVGNRVWGLMFGRAWHEPVDDLPDPAPLADGERGDLLDRLDHTFRSGGYSVKRLVRTIAASRAFRVGSEVAEGTDERRYDALAGAGAVFRPVRLRPEQMIGAMSQAASVRTLGGDRALLTRALRWVRETDFVRDYGDLGEDELSGSPATVPQALLRLNGELAADLTGPNPFNAAGRVAAFAGPPAAQVEAAFLACLTRRPTVEEAAAFAAFYEDGDGEAAIADVFWTLFNAPEFSWTR